MACMAAVSRTIMLTTTTVIVDMMTTTTTRFLINVCGDECEFFLSEMGA
jgi:hypothetical protein